jgi:hypothetical protein
VHAISKVTGLQDSLNSRIRYGDTGSVIATRSWVLAQGFGSGTGSPGLPDTAAALRLVIGDSAQYQRQRLADSSQAMRSLISGKENTLSKGNLTEVTSSVLTISGGTSAVIGSGTTIQVKQAGSGQGGFLSSGDWTTFNAKQPALTLGNFTESTSSVLTITGGTGAVIGSGLSLQVKQAGSSQSGYLSGSDWLTFNAKAPTVSPTFTGTVTLPIGLTGTLRATAGVVTATPSDSAGIAALLFGKIAKGDTNTYVATRTWVQDQGYISSATTDSSSNNHILIRVGDNIVDLNLGVGMSLNTTTRTLSATGGGGGGTGLSGYFAVTDYGADSTGSAECASQLQDAADVAAAAGGVLHFPNGTYKTASTVTIASAVSSASATISMTASTEPAVIFEAPDDQTFTYGGREVHFPTVSYAGHTDGGTSWPADSTTCVGVKITKSLGWRFYFQVVRGFTVGVLVGGSTEIAAYNTLLGGTLANNRVNLAIGASSTGWTNANYVKFMRFEHDGTPPANCCHIQIRGNGSNPPDDLVFESCAIEAGGTGYYIMQIDAALNIWRDCRFESQGGAPHVWLGTNAAPGNEITGMYAETIVFDGPATYVKGAMSSNEMGSYRRSPGNYPAFTGVHMSDTEGPVFTVMDYNSTWNTNRNTRWTWAASSDWIAGKATADSNATPKWKIGNSNGNADFSGTLTKGAGSFKIDNPANPDNEFLQHSFVESPDMMNVYNGIVTTGKDSTATIEMPDWFMPLNRDFRYQLTTIGSFARVMVLREMKDGRFTIKSAGKNVKVSWQVTGIRHDPFAEKNRIPTVTKKLPDEIGKRRY